MAFLNEPANFATVRSGYADFTRQALLGRGSGDRLGWFLGGFGRDSPIGWKSAKKKTEPAFADSVLFI